MNVSIVFNGLFRAKTVLFCLLVCALFFSLSLTPAVAEPPQFSKPVKCVPNDECIIQQYVDLDPSPGTLDYQCGQQTYEGHKGTDFRLVNARVYQKGIEVIASAPGRVLHVRDGIQDRLITSKADLRRVKGKECGNGLVIDHGNGWQGQYCHLKQHSIVVRSGQKVSRGQTLGLVGLSGKTEMPHVHLTFRHKGKVIDPFIGEMVGSSKTVSSCQLTGRPLWDEETLRAFPYHPSQILEIGLTSHIMKVGEREIHLDPSPLTPLSDKLVLFARVANFLKGDQLQLRLTGPGGFKATHLVGPLKRNKARYKAIAGKKRRSKQWPVGKYQGVVTILRNNKIISKKQLILDLK